MACFSGFKDVLSQLIDVLASVVWSFEFIKMFATNIEKKKKKKRIKI